MMQKQLMFILCIQSFFGWAMQERGNIDESLQEKRGLARQVSVIIPQPEPKDIDHKYYLQLWKRDQQVVCQLSDALSFKKEHVVSDCLVLDVVLHQKLTELIAQLSSKQLNCCDYIDMPRGSNLPLSFVCLGRRVVDTKGKKQFLRYANMTLQEALDQIGNVVGNGVPYVMLPVTFDTHRRFEEC